MKFSLIICTFKRPRPVITLLNSIKEQVLYPDEILLVDGSPDSRTKEVIGSNDYPQLKYYRVEETDRGLTKQRNFGVSRVGKEVEVVCFLDDDVVLTPNYFKTIMETYISFPDAVGVGGYILNEVAWERTDQIVSDEEFVIDGYKRKLGSRNLLRKRVGLLSKEPPGVMPEFSNGLSIGFLPPSGKIYPVEFFMGGVASFKKKIFQKMSFSTYFEGYGLYEDLEFCLRASKIGQLYVNTAAQLFHYHEPDGRPNRYKYGEMVIRNGWYVWRLKYPHPNLKSVLKWHATAFLLTLVRIGNVLTTPKKKEALSESLGRITGWWSLLLNPPKHET